MTIETNGLTRDFGALRAVADLDLHIPAGELYGFLGPNGAGKTTTIRMLVGLLTPTAGRARIAGHDIQAEPLAARRAFGYVAQEPLLYDRLTGREFLHFVGGLYGLSEDEAAARAAAQLTDLNLLDKADQLIEGYSGGMKRKLGLAAALLHAPPVLILDEPLTGLDPQSARQVKDQLHALCAAGTTVFMSTHILEIAERVCDRVGILSGGRLIAEGSLADLRARSAAAADATLEDVFLQLTGGVDVAPLAAELAG